MFPFSFWWCIWNKLCRLVWQGGFWISCILDRISITVVFL
jgi:hypothetical protein